MLDSIYVGMTGLLGYSKGLRVIASNTANINTPGFKGSSLEFSDLFYTNNSTGGDAAGYNSLGHGLNAGATVISFAAGEIRPTGNPLDVAIDGQGFFMLRDASGHITYTRAGQFKFNGDGVLVNQSDGYKVLGTDSSGSLAEITINGMAINHGQATANVKFNGNLSSTVTDQTVGGVKVLDSLGGVHTLDLKFTNTSTTTAGSWKVDLMEAGVVKATNQIVFTDGKPTAATAKLNFSYTPAASGAIPLVFDFSTDVTSYSAGSLSTLAMYTQDGILPGGLTKASFDATGTLVLTYSNNQTVKTARLALGKFSTTDAVGAVGDNQFEALDPAAWSTGTAGDAGFGAVQSGSIEISNVNLSQEFSDLVVMQRGFQASSQVVSTANEMLQELFAMKSK